MAKKPEERYATVHDLIMDLEAVARGEPPLQARKQYDAQLLQGLEESGETVEMESPVGEVRDYGNRVPLVWVFVLGALFCLSLLINFILLASRSR